MQDGVEEGMRNLNLTGHVGFDSLPDQLVNKATSQGFCFNILCIGETGIGKSTLMNTLFNTSFEGICNVYSSILIKFCNIEIVFNWDFSNALRRSPYVFSGIFYEFVNKNEKRYNFETAESRNLKFRS